MKTKIINIRMINRERPYYDIYIGRALNYPKAKFEESKWHNPHLTLSEYKLYILNKISEMPEQYNLAELEGKILGCWCKPKPCHGDVLIELISMKKNLREKKRFGIKDE